MRTRTTTVAVVAMLLATGAAQAAITIDTVPVGNPGNAADTRYETPGYGSVSYSYNIGKYEVTAGQYTAFLTAVGGVDTYALYNTEMDTAVYHLGCNIKRTGSSGSYTYSVDPNWANRPVNFVSWGDAARFANWLTNGQPTGAQDANTTEDGSYYLNGATSNEALLVVTRKTVAQGGRYYIPTEDEWYKAAYHKNDGVTGNYWDYPTSTNSVPSNDLLTPDGGNNANFDADGYASYTIGSPYYRTPVGEFENSESPYGTFDQGGNAWEWNEAIISSVCRGLLGGSFFDCDSSLLALSRSGTDPTYEMFHVGFRVSEVPEPLTIGILAFGGAGLLMRHRGLRR